MVSVLPSKHTLDLILEVRNLSHLDFLLKWRFKAKPYSPLRIILTGKMVSVSALLTVKQ